MSSHLALPIRLPFEEKERHARLDTLTKSVANTLIERYWTPERLTEVTDYSYQAWKYFDEAKRSLTLICTSRHGTNAV